MTHDQTPADSPQPQTPPPTPQPGQPDGEARILGALAHGLGICAPIIAPLIIWLVKKDELPAIDRPCKEALNFQLTFHGGMLLVSIFACIPSMVIPPMICVMFPLALLISVIGLVVLVLQIIATVAVYEGKDYRYPVNVRLV